MSNMVFPIVEDQNVLSVLGLVVIFLGTILFVIKNMAVLWIHGEDFFFGTSVHNVQPRIPQMKMMKVHIPFTFKLQEASNSSYDEIRCVVSSQACYRLEAYWGVSIHELHSFLWRPWNNSFQSTAQSLHYQHSPVTITGCSHGEKTIVLSLSEQLELGAPPRLCYPLVIFLVRDAWTSLQPDETVALINVVHIKDNVCTLPTSILAQYLKQANGQLSCLKQLYLATANPLTYDSSSYEIVDGTEQLCVVCQYYPLSRALLPCRHTCVCAACFGKLDSCPMCRSPIKSFFCIRGEEYLPDYEKSGTNTTKIEPLSQWFQDRLTDFLGFQR